MLLLVVNAVVDVDTATERTVIQDLDVGVTVDWDCVNCGCGTIDLVLISSLLALVHSCGSKCLGT
jgi:hypothetical protein